MSDPITAIIDGILAAEGAAYTNDPADGGGPTKYGVTQAALSEYLGHSASIAEVQALEEADARTIYYDRYVSKPGFGLVAQLSVPIARELIDTGVNMGQAVAAIFLQRVLNAFNAEGKDYADIPADGQCGTRTLTALRAYLARRPQDGERVMLVALNCLQGERYIEIAEKRASQERFVFGWMRARVAA